MPIHQRSASASSLELTRGCRANHCRVNQIIRLSNERRRRWGLGKRGEAEADLRSVEIRYQRFWSGFNKSLPSTARRLGIKLDER